jgi:LPXTG-motif cell wall-anchored protein
LNSVSEYTSDTAKEWKVTLLDTARTFTAQAANGATTTKDAGYSNWSVDITYSNAKTDTNEYVSAMICDENDNVLYYGNIAQNSASGTQTVNIPTGLAVGNYTLKVFSDIALEVTPPKAETPTGFTATSENGGTLNNVTTNMQYSIDGGANWNVTGTTIDIADVTAANGVQVYAKGEAGITADSDETITVTQAVKPAGLTKTDCTTAANNDGKISGVNNTMEYRVSGSTDAWTAVTGATITGLSNQSYDVRIKASGTVLASEAQSISISAYVAPPAPTAADYTDVDKAISEIPADLSVYTNASVNVLNDAVAAVDRNKTQAEQATVNGYATAIRDAIKALKYKDADYSKVDTAIGKIPADLSGYTDASVKALNDAKKAVVRGKNITEQATVDGYATAIQKAIDGLVKKTGTTGNNNNNNNNDSNKDKNVTSPQTGDSSNMFLWLAILMISAGGIVTIGITQKTRKKHSER